MPVCPCAHSRSKQVVFTRRHENERFSSSPYSGVNLVEAPVDFERFSADNESLVDALCAVYGFIIRVINANNKTTVAESGVQCVCRAVSAHRM